MQMTFEPQTVPLQMDEYGTIRVGGTRVRLDQVFRRTCEAKAHPLTAAAWKPVCV